MSELQFMLNFDQPVKTVPIGQSQESEFDQNWKLYVEADRQQRKSQLDRHLAKARVSREAESTHADVVSASHHEPPQKAIAVPKRKDHDGSYQSPKAICGEAAKANLDRLNADIDRHVAAGKLTQCPGCRGWLRKANATHCEECRDDSPTSAKRKQRG